MEGLKIKHRDKIYSVAVENGFTTIFITMVDGIGSLSISSVNLTEKQDEVWCPHTLMELNDSVEIEVIDITDTLPAEKIIKHELKNRSQRKLENFYRLEASLKKRGLL